MLRLDIYIFSRVTYKIGDLKDLFHNKIRNIPFQNDESCLSQISVTCRSITLVSSKEAK